MFVHTAVNKAYAHKHPERSNTPPDRGRKICCFPFPFFTTELDELSLASVYKVAPACEKSRGLFFQGQQAKAGHEFFKAFVLITAFVPLSKLLRTPAFLGSGHFCYSTPIVF